MSHDSTQKNFTHEWVLAAVPPAADVLQQAGYPEWLAELLARRGVDDPAAAEAFLHPDLEQLHDPYLLTGVEPAVERLLRAKANNEPIALVGDYDVDGVTGTALLAAVGQACGLEMHPILPHRMREGYGFQPVHVEQAVASSCRVVVTVDCGSTSFAAAQAAVDAGLDVVVTDHHLPGEQSLPDGVIQINPQQEGCAYPFSELSGAGLAFKLALALAKACERPINPAQLARVACLGTIADLVPLRGENRVIAAIGLEELSKTHSVGLRALIQVAGIKPPFSAADVGFRLGPRLNAPGRLDSATRALDLLLSRDARAAYKIANDLDRWNRQRQDWERKVADEARDKFLSLSEMPAILIASSPGWHRGVVGIAAGRLAKEFHRPVVLLAEKDGLTTGSGRSIEGIHLHEFFARESERYERFGGHAQAIGLTVRADDFDELRALWEEEAEVWREQIRVKRLEYELDLTPRQVTPTVLEQLQQLEPFGQKNPAPLVRLGPLKLVRAPRRFGRGHLSAAVTGRDGGHVRLVGWGWGDKVRALEGEVEVLGYLEMDRYYGGPSFRLIDSRPYTSAGPPRTEPLENV